MNIPKYILCLLAAVASFVLSSCATSGYYRSSSKDGMREEGRSQSFNPLADMVNVQIGGALVGGGCFSTYGRSASCPPGYGGGYGVGYQRPPVQCPPNYRRPMPYPPQYSGGYGPRPCPPGYNNGGGNYGPPRRPYLGSGQNPITMYGATFSDYNPGGYPGFDPRRRR